MDEFIPFALPDIGDEEINEVIDSMKSGWITTGPKTKRFETEFAKFVNSKFAMAVNSATSGLHLALDAIGVKRGDKVITTPYTFTSTAEVIRYFDADPVFCDIDPDTYNIDVKKLKTLVETLCKKTDHNVKAIMPVHFGGQACMMDEIIELAKEYNLKVIEDAAHALPTYYKDRIIGSLSDITVFSFYATKTLATAEGGMITTDNPDYQKRINIMRLHGFNRDAWDRYTSKKALWYYEIVAPGFKYNMPDISAAMGIHQLAKVNRFNERRQFIAKKYHDAFKNISGIKTPTEIKESTHCYHLFVIQVAEEIRNEFIERMRESGVGCSVHFIPLHIQPYWKDQYLLKEEDFPVATKAYKQAVSLPIYTKMTDEQVDRVITKVKEVILKC